MLGSLKHVMLGIVLFATPFTQAQEVEMMPLEKLPSFINTDLYDESSPILSLDGKALYFTRSGSPDFNRTLVRDGMDISELYAESDYRSVLSSIYSEISSEQITEPYSSAFNQDIWVAHMMGDTIMDVSHPGFPINNALPNSVLSARLDSHQLVVVNQFYSDGTMREGFSSVHGQYGSSFSFPRPLHIYNFYNHSTDVNLALSTRGQVMILSLQRQDSHGEKDLYVSFKIQEDLWSEPQNLGPVLNSFYTETTPFISQDNRRLYFASNRPGSYGGLDIWVCERLDYTWMKWTQPKPLKSPINSEWDDSQPFVDEMYSNFYFASRRDGSSDLFRLPLKPKPKLKEPIRINGMIVDGVTLRPVRGELLFGPADVKGYLEYYHTFDGKFSFELTEYGAYKFLAHKPGYVQAHLMFDTRLAEKANLPDHEVILYIFRDVDSPVNDPLPLIPSQAEEAGEAEKAEEAGEAGQTAAYAPLRQPEEEAEGASGQEETSVFTTPPKTGDKITFYNIYFEQSKPEILPTSRKALDELYKMLTVYNDINILIEGHTDNVGNELDLLELSWQRAQAIKVYLVRNGIDPVRISTAGFGDRHPVADNRTEEGRVKNRRVEVQVVD